MDQSGDQSGKTFQVKLVSGRVLGPLDLNRIYKFIDKGQIKGTESVRENPTGEWKLITEFPELLDLLVKKLGSNTFIGLPGAPVVPASTESGPEAVTSTVKLEEDAELPPSSSPVNDGEATLVATRRDLEQVSDGEKTVVGVLRRPEPADAGVAELGSAGSDSALGGDVSSFAAEAPVVSASNLNAFSHPVEESLPTGKIPRRRKKSKLSVGQMLMVGVLSGALGYLGYDSFLAAPEVPRVVRLEPVRPKLPEVDKTKVDSEKSVRVYNEGIKFYLDDTVLDYRRAVEKFRAAVTLDPNNVKALAMLASSYLNLIDSSDKDENYFDVLSRLIEMSRAKSIDLAETVIADVEFYIVVNKSEAAQNRIIEYTKAHQNYGPEMFYYLALAFYARGDYSSAAHFIAQFPDSKVFSSKINYLKGQVAEKLKDTASALREYEKAIAFNEKHVRSRLRIAAILNDQGKLAAAANHLNYNVAHISFLSPPDMAETYFFHSQLMNLEKKFESAAMEIDNAVKIDPENHKYLLEMYTLKAKSGDAIKSVQGQARMYFFLGEGEKLVQLGKYQDAMVPFLEARQANDASPIPLVKIGDMFSYIHDTENARKNYKIAAEKAPNDIQVWSKYIKALIQSYEWDEANKAMDRFRQLPVSQSSIDKAAADMYQQQGRFVDAQVYYKKAMARPSIDPEVYVAYAKSLMSTKNFKDAPFFFALALRFDPLNIEAIINTAKCVAETESIDRAIGMLQDNLNTGSTARPEYLGAIAELQMQRGSWEQAQQNVSQAIQINPDYAYSYKLQARIDMNRENTDKTALSRALVSYKSYSERNLSDPSGYLERYRIFIKQTEYEKAKEELNRIYEIYPKYPNLHFYLGALYAIQGNHKVAIDEFKIEIQNNPLNLQSILAYGKELNEVNEVNAYREALNQFTRAMQMAPHSADAKQNAGWTNYKLQNYTAAIALLREAIVLDQANPVIHKRLGIVYRDMGDMPSACVSFRRYLEIEPDASDRNLYQSCF
jgi:tetratricopeptide (TPR) repeat protein